MVDIFDFFGEPTSTKVSTRANVRGSFSSLTAQSHRHKAAFLGLMSKHKAKVTSAEVEVLIQQIESSCASQMELLAVNIEALVNDGKLPLELASLVDVNSSTFGQLFSLLPAAGPLRRPRSALKIADMNVVRTYDARRDAVLRSLVREFIIFRLLTALIKSGQSCDKSLLTLHASMSRRLHAVEAAAELRANLAIHLGPVKQRHAAERSRAGDAGYILRRQHKNELTSIGILRLLFKTMLSESASYALAVGNKAAQKRGFVSVNSFIFKAGVYIKVFLIYIKNLVSIIRTSPSQAYSSSYLYFGFLTKLYNFTLASALAEYLKSGGRMSVKDTKQYLKNLYLQGFAKNTLVVLLEVLAFPLAIGLSLLVVTISKLIDSGIGFFKSLETPAPGTPISDSIANHYKKLLSFGFELIKLAALPLLIAKRTIESIAWATYYGLQDDYKSAFIVVSGFAAIFETSVSILVNSLSFGVTLLSQIPFTFICMLSVLGIVKAVTLAAINNVDIVFKPKTHSSDIDLAAELDKVLGPASPVWDAHVVLREQESTSADASGASVKELVQSNDHQFLTFWPGLRVQPSSGPMHKAEQQTVNTPRRAKP